MMETVQEALSRDLYAYLVDELYSVPAPRRKRSAWVMGREWYDECAKIGGWHAMPTAKHMLGRPLFVTEDGGFPHLIAD